MASKYIAHAQRVPNLLIPPQFVKLYFTGTLTKAGYSANTQSGYILHFFWESVKSKCRNPARHWTAFDGCVLALSE